MDLQFFLCREIFSPFFTSSLYAPAERTKWPLLIWASSLSSNLCPSAFKHIERRPTAQNRGVPTVISAHSDPMAVTLNGNMIEYIDLTADSLDPFGERAVIVGVTLVHIHGNIHCH